MSSTDPLIHLSDVKKVFYTDEVETHALSGIHLDIKKGRISFDRRSFRLRQVNPAVDSRFARHADRRRVRAQRPSRSKIFRCRNGRGFAIAKSDSSSRASI